MFGRAVPEYEPSDNARTRALMSFAKLAAGVAAVLADRHPERTDSIDGVAADRAYHVFATVHGYVMLELAGMAGAMIGTVGTFNPSAAASFTLMSFVVAVLGGLGNMYGALVGGLVIGLVQAWGGQYLPGTWVNALAFLVLIVVLIFRPTGLVGRAFYAARQEV